MSCNDDLSQLTRPPVICCGDAGCLRHFHVGFFDRDDLQNACLLYGYIQGYFYRAKIKWIISFLFFITKWKHINHNTPRFCQRSRQCSILIIKQPVIFCGTQVKWYFMSFDKTYFLNKYQTLESDLMLCPVYMFVYITLFLRIVYKTSHVKVNFHLKKPSANWSEEEWNRRYGYSESHWERMSEQLGSGTDKVKRVPKKTHTYK